MYLGVVIDKSKVLPLALRIFVFRTDSHYLPHKLNIRMDSDQANVSMYCPKIGTDDAHRSPVAATVIFPLLDQLLFHF